MAKSLKSTKKAVSSLMTFENMVGLILTVLIVFDLKVEVGIANMINSPVGMAISLLTLITMFISMNPIVAILFLVYLYETVKYSSSLISSYSQPIENLKHSVMKKLNPGKQMDNVEVEVIKKMAPIVKKSEKFNVNFKPNSTEKNHYTTL